HLARRRVDREDRPWHRLWRAAGRTEARQDVSRNGVDPHGSVDWRAGWRLHTRCAGDVLAPGHELHLDPINAAYLGPAAQDEREGFGRAELNSDRSQCRGRTWRHVGRSGMVRELVKDRGPALVRARGSRDESTRPC